MRRSRKGSGKLKLLVIPLVLSAAWVNREVLKGLVGWKSQATTIVDPNDLYVPEDDRPVAAAPLGQTASMKPVNLVEAIRSPMIHGLESRSPEETEVDESSVVALPAVTFILHGKSRRALIEGQVLGVGDETRAGIIVAIEPKFVQVRSKSGKVRRLELGSRRPTKSGPEAKPEGSSAAGNTGVDGGDSKKTGKPGGGRSTPAANGEKKAK